MAKKSLQERLARTKMEIVHCVKEDEQKEYMYTTVGDYIMVGLANLHSGVLQPVWRKVRWEKNKYAKVPGTTIKGEISP